MDTAKIQGRTSPLQAKFKIGSKNSDCLPLTVNPVKLAKGVDLDGEDVRNLVAMIVEVDDLFDQLLNCTAWYHMNRTEYMGLCKTSYSLSCFYQDF